MSEAIASFFEEKFRRSPHGRVEGYGLVVLPK